MPSLSMTDREKGTILTKNYNMNHESLSSHKLPALTQVNIYTDGSKTDSHVGAGYTIFINGRETEASSIKLSTNATVFQAEIIAIREAVKSFNHLRQDDLQYVKILTDSQAAFFALASTQFTSKVVKETILELNKLGEHLNRLEIVWIKAHTGNERADNLARDAVYHEEIQLHIAESWTHYKNKVWETIYQEWEIDWQSEDKYRMTKQFYKTPTRKQHRDTLSLNRNDMKIWIEITTGQNNLNYVQSKIYNTSPTCRFCEEEDETFYHLLTECPSFEETRSSILLAHNTTIDDWTIKQILKFAKTPAIKFALSFEQFTDMET